MLCLQSSSDCDSQALSESNPLCSECEAVLPWTRRANIEDSEIEVFEHKTSFQALETSASTCPLCCFVLNRVFCDSNWTGGRDGEPSKYETIVHIEPNIQRSMFGIRWRETSLTPDPRVQDSEPYYFTAPNCPGKKSPWQLNQGFDARLQTVAEWLSKCETHHAECRETVSILPKRLLGLEQTEHSKVLKLVESSAITEKNIRYATLSHCWGPKTSAPPLRTTSSNIKDHIQEISLEELTLNFRHAVSICLKLGIRYLWIDSLCIIQDSQADWEAEAAKMADIYRSGYLNIAAVAASDAHEGFIRDELVESQRDRFTDIKYTIGPDNVQELISLQPSFGFEEFRHLSANTYPYFSRGWILQEQILAPRTVPFPSGQFFWQCRHWFSSEDGTLSSKSLLTVSNGDTNLWTKLDINSRYLGQVAWYNWAGSFIRRQLLYASDIGPAIGGLIRFYSSQMGYTPILGLWKETLAFDLGWRLTNSTAGKQPDKPGNENNFPSWTWLSILPFPDSDGSFNQSIMIDEDTSYLEIKTWEEKWSGPAYTSKLQSSRLVVSGLVRTKTVNMDGTEYKASSEQGKQYEILVSGSTSETGRWSVEYPFSPGQEAEVKLLHLCQSLVGTPDGAVVQDYFLVIMEKGDRPGCFFRVGVGSVRTTVDPKPSSEKLRGIHFRRTDRETVELV